MENYLLAEETVGYNTADHPANLDPRYLVSGSKNVLIDRQKAVRIGGGGYARLGAANSALTPTRNAWTWWTSTGTELPMKFYDDELEVYLGTIDTVAINAWTRVLASWSTTEIMRAATWWDTTENIDLLITVQGDANMYEWNGAVAVVGSITGTTVTKQGTNTFAQNRFYTTRNKTFIVARTGTEYTYTGGETTTALTGITDTAGIQAGDVLIQKMVTNTNEPAASRNNHTIFQFENQLYVGSEDDNEVYVTQNDSYTDTTFSSPRVAGEGTLLTLDAPVRGFGVLGKSILIFAGRHFVFRAEYQEITVNITLTEILRVKKLQTGVDYSAQNQEVIIPMGNALAYLSYEPALRIIENPDTLEGISPKTLSNPIKPDFDAEDFTNACGIWFRNSILLSSPVNSKVYILEFIEDADGQLRRFWQAPQVLPVRAFSIISGNLHGHSNGVPETYRLFNGLSGVNSSDEKLPIHAIALFARNTYKKRGNLKAADEYYVEGEIQANTIDLELALGFTSPDDSPILTKIINGSDQDLLEGSALTGSLGDSALGINPIGGTLVTPENAIRFRVDFEFAKEDFHELQPQFSSNAIDRYWKIISHGSNAKISPRKNTKIKK